MEDTNNFSIERTFSDSSELQFSDLEVSGSLEFKLLEYEMGLASDNKKKLVDFNLVH